MMPQPRVETHCLPRKADWERILHRALMLHTRITDSWKVSAQGGAELRVPEAVFVYEPGARTEQRQSKDIRDTLTVQPPAALLAQRFVGR
eukprot:8875521-Pyramimonas_sp.AAC.1